MKHPHSTYIHTIFLGLFSHIKAFHKSHAEKWGQQKAANDLLRQQHTSSTRKKQKKNDGTKQPTLGGVDGSLQIRKYSDCEVQKRYDAARVMFCARTMISFNAMEHDHLLVEALLPKTHSKVVKKSCRTIARHTTQMANKLRREMLSLILTAKATNQSFAFSSDMYKSRSLFSLISLTVHFLSPSYELVKLVVYADYFGARRHTADNILFSLNTMMTALGLDGEDISRYIILDNAANNKRAMFLGTDIYETIWCCCHTIQLAIKDALKVKLGQVSVGKVLDKCRNIATLVKRSESSRDSLKGACKAVVPEVSFIMPIKPMAVHWNSTDNNVASILHLEKPLRYLDYHDEDTWSEVVPGAREFEVAAAVHKCLEPLKIATKGWE